MRGSICSTDEAKASKSPTPFNSVTCSRSFFTAAYASDGTIAPLLIRAASNATSAAKTSNFRTKYANASSELLPGYEPTAFSPCGVLTKTVPSSATRPNAEGSPINALAALACGGKFISVMRVILSARYLVQGSLCVGAMLRRFEPSKRGSSVDW